MMYLVMLENSDELTFRAAIADPVKCKQVDNGPDICTKKHKKYDDMWPKHASVLTRRAAASQKCKNYEECKEYDENQ